MPLLSMDDERGISEAYRRWNQCAVQFLWNRSGAENRHWYIVPVFYASDGWLLDFCVCGGGLYRGIQAGFLHPFLRWSVMPILWRHPGLYVWTFEDFEIWNLNSILLRNRLTFSWNYDRISSVVRHNTDAVVAQLDRALGYGPRCREFESSRPHNLKLSNLLGSFFSYK